MHRIPVSGSSCALVPVETAYHMLLIIDYYRKMHHTSANNTINYHTTYQNTINRIKSSRKHNYHTQFSTTQNNIPIITEQLLRTQHFTIQLIKAIVHSV